jgi:hypothetical protein
MKPKDLYLLRISRGERGPLLDLNDQDQVQAYEKARADRLQASAKVASRYNPHQGVYKK